MAGWYCKERTCPILHDYYPGSYFWETCFFSFLAFFFIFLFFLVWSVKYFVIISLFFVSKPFFAVPMYHGHPPSTIVIDVERCKWLMRRSRDLCSRWTETVWLIVRHVRTFRSSPTTRHQSLLQVLQRPSAELTGRPGWSASQPRPASLHAPASSLISI